MQLSKGCTKLDVKHEEEKEEKIFYLSTTSQDPIRIDTNVISHITARVGLGPHHTTDQPTDQIRTIAYNADQLVGYKRRKTFIFSRVKRGETTLHTKICAISAPPYCICIVHTRSPP